MSIPQSYVLEGYTLLQFMQYVIDNHTTASWCIICSSREAFTARLEEDLDQYAAPAERHDLNDLEFATAYLQRSLKSRLTMRLLASCSTLRVVFVSDIVHLRASLASLITSGAATVNYAKESSLVAILDPISIHRPTTSFSAQGFNRTFATAVEAAHAHGSGLVLCETSPNLQRPQEGHDADDATEDVAHDLPPSPWDEDIGIVDIRTKTFGPGSRGWVGRTVKIRQIAERWMVFKQARH